MKDVRSTGRRRCRAALYEAYVPFKCCDCGKTTITPPKDAPKHFEEIWPEEDRVLSTLHCDHLTKDLTINDDQNCVWRCPSCHRNADKKTSKGESTIDTNRMW